MNQLPHAGTGASLAKDVPFAALYWTMLEPLRGTMLQLLSGDRAAGGAMTPELGEAPRPRTSTELLGVNIASAGAAACMRNSPLSLGYLC